MPHPDLYDELTQTLISGFDTGTLYARIDGERGLTWQHTTHGGHDDALPRPTLLIASVLQQYIEDGGDAIWQNRNGIDGILWTDENQWMPLHDIGVNRKIGFYQLSASPDQRNDAEMPPHDTDL